MERKARVAVVGGGSTGSSILYHLAKAGEVDTVLIEKGSQIASGQTSRSTALVRTHYTIETVARMAQLSYGFFKRFEQELPGHTAGYVETGLIIGADERSAPTLEDNVRMLGHLGLKSKVIDCDEAAALEPNLDPDGFASIVYEPQSGYAEPSTTASSFASAAQSAGARVMLGTVVTELERTSHGFSIGTSAGTVVAEKVVFATGPWSGPILRRLGVAVPIKCVRHPVAIFRRPDAYVGTHPVIFDFKRSAYSKPEGNRLLFEGSLELELDESSGPVDPDDYDQGITFEEVESFSASLAAAIPIMSTEGAYERGYSGVYDNTPDQQPVIDEFSAFGWEGIYCVVGLSGHGFKLCPEFGRVLSELVLNGKFRDYDVSIFRLKRFEEGALLRGKYPVSTIG